MSISVMIKPVSGNCNMSCTYCFYADEAEKREQYSYGVMSEQTLKNVIRRTLAGAEGSASYVFQGGEPTLRGLDFYRQVVTLQKQYNKKHIAIQNALQTNGYDLDQEWCTFLAENDFLVGISVDGVQQTHDGYRHSMAGAATYERVLQTISRLEQTGVAYNILTVVHKKIAQKIEEIYADYRKRGWRYQQYIACLDPYGEPRGARIYSLKPKEYGLFLVRLFSLWYADWQLGRQPYIRQFENYVGIIKGYQPESCEQKRGCSVQYVVEADGSVFPCDFYAMDRFRLGNFNENRISEIEEQRRKTGFLEHSMELGQACQECEFFLLCKGGCYRNRDEGAAGGDRQNYFCEGYRLFFSECLERLQEVAAQGTVF